VSGKVACNITTRLLITQDVTSNIFSKSRSRERVQHAALSKAGLAPVQ
jgi:hypothetical protein